jgi:parvulin-like peptidyl-prolyl isomerase
MDLRVMDRVGQPTEADLRAYYDENRQQFWIPPRAHVRYLMAMVEPSAAPPEWEAAKARLEPYLERLRAGEPFERIRDAAAAEAGIEAVDLGLLHEGQAEIQEIGQAAFSLAPGQISEPVWTLFGYALVFVTEREDGRQLGFDELNRELFAREWLAARREEARQTWVRELVEAADIQFSP